MLLAGCVSPRPLWLPDPDATDCRTGWTEIHHIGIRDGSPLKMVWNDGILYFGLDEPPQIVAVDATDGAARLLAEESVQDLWVEGDQLLYASQGDKLFALPLSGGTPRLVLDAQTALNASIYGLPEHVELDPSYFYWDLQGQHGSPRWSWWRMPRAGGAAEMMGTAPLQPPSAIWSTLNLSARGAVISRYLAQDEGVAPYFMAPSAGEPRPLAYPSTPPLKSWIRMEGHSATSILWSQSSYEQNSYPPSSRIMISDTTGSAADGVRPFWTGKPPRLAPGAYGTWPDGDGGWIVAGQEPLFGGELHTSVWAVDADGNGRRLGCSASDAVSVSMASAILPDAVYVVVGFANSLSPSYDYGIVEVDRRPR